MDLLIAEKKECKMDKVTSLPNTPLNRLPSLSIQPVQDSYQPGNKVNMVTNHERVLLSVNQVAELTGRGRSSVWNDIRNHLFPVVRVGNRVLVLWSDLEVFLQANRTLYQERPKLNRGPRTKKRE